MKREACISITVGKKREEPKELLPDITQLVVFQREAGRRKAIVVTWTPEKITPGTGVLTAGEDFGIIVGLHNPHGITVSGVVYITIDGMRITEGKYNIKAKRPAMPGTQVKGASIPEARAYEICAGVEA